MEKYFFNPFLPIQYFFKCPVNFSSYFKASDRAPENKPTPQATFGTRAANATLATDDAKRTKMRKVTWMRKRSIACT